MLPLEVSNVENHALVKVKDEAKEWHLCYGHLNVKGLKLLHHKRVCFDNLKKFKAMVEKQSDAAIKIPRTDRGGEFCSNNFSVFCEVIITLDLAAPYTPEQNGVAERRNRAVLEMARSLLKAKELPNSFWIEAVATTMFLLNLSPIMDVPNRTLHEVWRGARPSVSHLRIFGCITYVLVNSQLHTKLDEKSEKSIFIWYCSQSKAYRLYNLVSGKVIICKNVIFDEIASLKRQRDKENPLLSLEITDSNTKIAYSNTINTPNKIPTNSPLSTSTPHNNSSSEKTPPRKFRSIKEIYETCTFALLVSDPLTSEQAIRKEE
ncbi:hypothetical protein GQ457_09G020710 [Hibiscus cannabinus]